MASPHPLNQAVIAQALHDLRNGQLRRCLSMGFSPNALEALKEPTIVSVLANAKVAWCRVVVNSALLESYVKQVSQAHQEVVTIDRMLRLGASTEMVSEFFALSHQEVALRRDMLKLPDRKGRWPVLTEAQDAALWERCRAEVGARPVALSDDAGMLSLGMDLAEELSLALSVVWSAIRSWIDQKMI